jgi:hypothetical protein
MTMPCRAIWTRLQPTGLSEGAATLSDLNYTTMDHLARFDGVAHLGEHVAAHFQGQIQAAVGTVPLT